MAVTRVRITEMGRRALGKACREVKEASWKRSPTRGRGFNFNSPRWACAVWCFLRPTIRKSWCVGSVGHRHQQLQIWSWLNEVFGDDPRLSYQQYSGNMPTRLWNRLKRISC